MANLSFSYCGPDVLVINSPKDWEDIEDRFVESIGRLGVVGLDCEWVESNNFPYKERREGRCADTANFDNKLNDIRILNGSSGKVALLQMASHHGIVLLIRLCLFSFIPKTLATFLENGNILKVGVNIETDVKKLFLDWGINTDGFVDIRNLVVQYPGFLDDYRKNGLGLKKLGNFLTGCDVDESKNNTVRYSHWAAQQLSPEQVEYARDDAIMAIDGMVAFAKKYLYADAEDDLSAGGDDFMGRLRMALSRHVNCPCSDYVTHILDAKDAVVSRKAEDRRRRWKDRNPVENSDSDIEFNYEGWRKSDCSKRAQMHNGLERAIVFRDDDGKDLAAIDSALLNALKDVDEPQTGNFDVKNERGDPIYEVRLQLKKRHS